MRTGLFTLLAAGLAALAGAATGTREFDFEKISGSIDPKNRNVSTRATNNVVTTSRAFATCTVESYSKAFTALEDIYTAAIDRVVKEVCADDWAGNYTAAAAIMKNFTIPVAEAVASASCTTGVSGQGSAHGCAELETALPDFEDVFGDLHVVACEKAFTKHCGCAKRWKWDFGDIEAFKDVSLSSFAETDVVACASGNQTVTAEAFIECFASVIAKTYAFAASKATVAAECYRGYKNSAVRKLVEGRVAELVIDCDLTVTNTTTAPKRPAPTKDDGEGVTVVVKTTGTGDGTTTATGKGSVTQGKSSGSTITGSVSLPK